MPVTHGPSAPLLLPTETGKLLVRDNAIILSIEHVRLIITADKVRGAGSTGWVEPVDSKGCAAASCGKGWAGPPRPRMRTSAGAAGKRCKCCAATQACAAVCAMVHVAFAQPQAFASAPL